MATDGVSDRSQAGRAGKCTLIEYAGYLGDVHCNEKLEHAGNRARPRGRLGQFDTINSTEFSNVSDRGEELTFVEALSRSLQYVCFFRRK